MTGDRHIHKVRPFGGANVNQSDAVAAKLHCIAVHSDYCESSMTVVPRFTSVSSSGAGKSHPTHKSQRCLVNNLVVVVNNQQVVNDGRDVYVPI